MMSSSCATRWAEVTPLGLMDDAEVGGLLPALRRDAGLAGVYPDRWGDVGGVTTPLCGGGRVGDKVRKWPSADCRMPAMRAASSSGAIASREAAGEWRGLAPAAEPPLPCGEGGKCGCILGLLLCRKGFAGDALRSCLASTAEGLPARAGRPAALPPLASANGAAGAGRAGVRGVEALAACCLSFSP